MISAYRFSLAACLTFALRPIFLLSLHSITMWLALRGAQQTAWHSCLTRCLLLNVAAHLKELNELKTKTSLPDAVWPRCHAAIMIIDQARPAGRGSPARLIVSMSQHSILLSLHSRGIKRQNRNESLLF